MRLAPVLVLAAAAAGCAGEPDSEAQRADPGGASCLAFATDFDGFRAWPSWHVPSNGTPDDVHAGLPHVEYLNRKPPPGSTAFPDCTIIVKEPDDGRDPTSHIYFAMVKRGGTYNAGGAVGWEWFELGQTSGGAMTIVWRGVGPPNGEIYGGDVTTCNACHAAGKDNDYVLSPAIRLSDF